MTKQNKKAYEVNSADAYLYPPKIIKNPGDKYSGDRRKFQGIPSIACTQKEKLWAVWYGGKTPGEDDNNYVILAAGSEKGENWSEEKVIIDPDGEGPVRAYDPEVWVDPEGKLWVFWAQEIQKNRKESLAGVWTITTDNPNKQDPNWSSPRRLTDGVMMCKPVVLSGGEWALPVSKWHRKDKSAQIIVSEDRGENWEMRGGCDVPEDVRSYDEHLIVEKQDGSLWMLVRTNYGIGESFSRDKGYTWSELQKSKIEHTTSRFFIRRLESGNLLLVKNGPINEDIGRSQLTALISEDDGQSWPYSLLLDERQSVTYPDGDQSSKGRIYIIYDYERRGAKEIMMSRLTEEDIIQGEIVSSDSKLKKIINTAD
ncbi:MAG: sialidase family protein [Halanaerobiaceae bacterium]